MRVRRALTLIPVILSLFIASATIALWPSRNAHAQCGSQASSCRNCHEVQGKDPVNNDGTGWHESHAFGDFCYLCHAGNNQSMVEEEAHAGMVAPLSDVYAACQSCHPDDLVEKAGVYAAVLGVEVGTGGGDTSGSERPEDTVSGPDNAPQPENESTGTLEVSGDLIDYNQRYEETLPGRKQVNWGNVVLVTLIILVGAGGGGFVYWNERRLLGLPVFRKRELPTRTDEAGASIPRLKEYQDEVVALLPMINRLDPRGVHALKRLLENPEAATEILYGISRLDPDLIKRIRSLDHDSRALLIALAAG